MEALDEEKQNEERDEVRTEVVAEDGERETRLRDGVPRPLDQMLKVRDAGGWKYNTGTQIAVLLTIT